MTGLLVIGAALYIVTSAVLIRHLERNDPDQPLWIVLVAHVLPGLLWLPIAIVFGAATIFAAFTDGDDWNGR